MGSSATMVGAELAEIFRSLAKQRRSGTLKVSDGTGRALYLYFRDGKIQLARSRRAKNPLGRALVKRRKVTERELEHALRLHRKTGAKLGQCCLKLGYCDDDAIREALVFQAIEEVSDVFTWSQPRSEFHRGEPPLDIFDFVVQSTRLNVGAEALVHEAQRRAGELLQIKRQLPSFADIYAPSPEALYAMKSPPEGSPDEELLRFLDGERDVEGVLEAVRLSELEALRTLVRLVRSGDVVALTPHQLVQVAQESARRGDKPKAHRLYLRAEAAGLTQLDLPNRIGKLAEALGRPEEAVARYLEFADRCRREDLPEAAVAAYRKALELDPGSVQAMEEVVSALHELGKSDEAGAILKRVAQRCDPVRHADKLQRTWQEVLRLMPEDLDAHRALGAMFEAQRDTVQAIMQLSELAAILLSKREIDEAIEVLRRVIALDPGCVEAHAQLATTLTQIDRTDEAVRQYEALAEALSAHSRAKESTDWRFMIDTYEKIVELDPQHLRARQWLAQAYRNKAQSDKAIGNYEALVAALRKDPDKQDELAEALSQYVQLQPDDFVAREDLGRVLVSLDRNQKAVTTLREAAAHALRGHHFDAVRRAAIQITEIAPFDLEAHQQLARAAVLEKDETGAFRRWHHLARLQALGGYFPEACESARKALDLRNDADLRKLLAEALEAGGHPLESGKEWVEVGRLESANQNIGRSRWAAERALELDPDLRAASDLIYMLDTQRSAAQVRENDWAERMLSKPSITGGGDADSIVERPRRTYGSVTGAANKLRAISGRLPAAQAEASGGPAQIADGASEFKKLPNSAKTINASARLRALKGGGAKAAAAPSVALPSPGRQPFEDGSATFKKIGGGKALKASARLRALKSGGAGATAPASEAAGPREAFQDGATVFKKVAGSKKTLSAAARLKALRGGGAPPSGPAAAPSRETLQDGATAFKKVAGSKKTLSAAARLKALRGGGAAPNNPGASAPAATEGFRDGASEFKKVSGSKKTLSAAARLKALRGGGSAPISAPAASTGSPAPPKIADGATQFKKVAGSKKTLSAAARLKALRGGGAPKLGAAPPVPSAVADGAAQFKKVSGAKKTLSAAARLKALKAGR